MRIAYLFQSIGIDFAESGAPQVHMHHIVRGLHRAGHSICLLSLRGRRAVLWTGDDLDSIWQQGASKDHIAKLGVSGSPWFRFLESGVRRVQSSLNLPYLAVSDTYRMFDASVNNLSGYELIHERFNSLALGGTLASRRLDVPLVLEVNADPFEEQAFQGLSKSWLYEQFAIRATCLACQRASAVICVSDQLKKHLIKRWLVDPGKITVLPNAADVNSFGKEYDNEALKDSLGLSTAPVVMFVGGFYPWHDVELLIDSFVEVVTRVPDAKLVLVGDGDAKHAVQQRIAEKGLEHAVVMTGSIEHSRVPRILAIADVAVAPNVAFFPGHGGSPLKLFEYMAAGKALVATRTGQVRQVIRDGDNGILVAPGDVAGFAEAIVALLTRPSERERLGHNARRQAVAQHSWEQYVERLERVYANALERESCP